MTAAPPSAYCSASEAGSTMLARSPLDGLRRLISAMTFSWSRGADGAAEGSPGVTGGGRGGGQVLQFRERNEALPGLHILPDTGIDVIENSHHQWPELFSLLPSTP